MRFLIEIEQRTTTSLVIEADSHECALEAVWGAARDDCLLGDPTPQPPTVKRITELRE
ncbi:hypothetical protein Y017_06830 [Alcanivorax sp. 97CO-5]|jgi:hypothetical protein|nr:hypothetical protein Y017_06830 [Alcanivorax sp. 97CO-5]